MAQDGLNEKMRELVFSLVTDGGMTDGGRDLFAGVDVPALAFSSVPSPHHRLALNPLRPEPFEQQPFA
jgi:hypothetical protein